MDIDKRGPIYAPPFLFAEDAVPIAGNEFWTFNINYIKKALWVLWPHHMRVNCLYSQLYTKLALADMTFNALGLKKEVTMKATVRFITTRGTFCSLSRTSEEKLIYLPRLILPEDLTNTRIQNGSFLVRIKRHS